MHWLSERRRHCDMWGYRSYRSCDIPAYRSPQLVGECSCDTDIAAAIQDVAVLRFVCATLSKQVANQPTKGCQVMLMLYVAAVCSCHELESCFSVGFALYLLNVARLLRLAC